MMNSKTYSIRVCLSCGLRYPLLETLPTGSRCPQCMGETEVVYSGEMSLEPPIRRYQKRNGKPMLAVLADNIRSAMNVGSILRSADGFGFDHAYLCGISPTPENEPVRKTSLGAEDYVTWSYHKDAVVLVKGLKKEGWHVLSLEEDKRSANIDKYKTTNRNTVLIVGNEVTGVDPELLQLADQILMIPMRGEKRSFNVANAFSVAAYALTEK